MAARVFGDAEHLVVVRHETVVAKLSQCDEQLAVAEFGQARIDVGDVGQLDVLGGVRTHRGDERDGEVLIKGEAETRVGHAASTEPAS